MYIKIIHLESSEEDFEIIQKQLTDSGYEVEIVLVNNKTGFSSSLRKNDYDIIFSAFNIDDIDAFEALQIRDRICPEVPFICISGSVGEETAIELLKLGAVDYVLKDNIRRLPFVVKRSMDEVKQKNLRKSAEEAMHQSENLYRSLVENINEIVYILDTNAVIKYISPNIEKIAGYKPAELVGKKYTELVHPDDRSGRLRQFLKIVSGINEPSEYRVLGKDGTVFWVRTNANIVFKSKPFVEIIGTLVDITDRKQMEQTLEEANKNLEEMVYIASHDLQTPLIAMQNFASELLKNYSNHLDREGVYCLERLRANSRSMHKLVISLLDISRLNTIKAKKNNVDIRDVIDNVISDLSLLIEENNVKINTGKMPVIKADQKRIVSAIRNIISNAINYRGKNINITFENNTIAFQDDGIGIPSKQLETIFKPGERLKKIDVEGVGMGLVFCRKVIEQHGGKIWADSDGNNKGSTFYIRFDPHTITKQEG